MSVKAKAGTECELTLLALAVLEQLHGLKGGTTTNELMGEVALVLTVVHLVALLTALVYNV